MVTAAIVGSPQPIAKLTVWKIGPEWVAQQAKKVAASTMKARLLSACGSSIVAPLGGAPAAPGWAATSAGAERTNNAAGMSVPHTSAAMIIWAVRQSTCVMSHAAKGETVMGATPTPTDTSETARLRWRSNHELTVEIIGAKKLPVAIPTRTP